MSGNSSNINDVDSQRSASQQSQSRSNSSDSSKKKRELKSNIALQNKLVQIQNMQALDFLGEDTAIDQNIVESNN